jgi:hypothetical protein
MIIILLALVALILSIVLVARKSSKKSSTKKEPFLYTKGDMEHLCGLQKQMFKQYPFINSPSNVEEAYKNCQKYWSSSMNMPSAFVKQQRF